MKKLINRRFLAFLIDYLIVFGLLLPLLTSSFYKKDTKLIESKIKIIEKVNKNSEAVNTGKLSKKKYNENNQKEMIKLTKLVIKERRENFLLETLTIMLIIIYYAILPIFTNGQSLGKRWMKIKVVDKEQDKLSIKTSIIRTTIIYGILSNIIIFTSLFLVKNVNMYLNITLITNLAYYLFLIIDFIFLLVKKGDSLHDVIAKTEVIEERD